jgi:nitrate reductase gamma subunit
MALAHLWFTTQAQRITSRTDSARDQRDRGDVLANAAVTVGLVIIAGIVILIIRRKAMETANNICTAADPTTCQ